MFGIFGDSKETKIYKMAGMFFGPNQDRNLVFNALMNQPAALGFLHVILGSLIKDLGISDHNEAGMIIVAVLAKAFGSTNANKLSERILNLHMSSDREFALGVKRGQTLIVTIASQRVPNSTEFQAAFEEFKNSLRREAAIIGIGTTNYSAIDLKVLTADQSIEIMNTVWYLQPVTEAVAKWKLENNGII